jgi:hypothetical protein
VSASPLAYALAAAAYAGFQLTVRLVVYPQLARVPPTVAADFERAHQRLITPLVGLLFGALALATAGLLAVGPRGPGLVAAVLFGGMLGATAFGAVPQHTTLSRGFDEAAHHRLLRWDTVRVVLALAQLALGVLTLRG